MPGFLDRPPTVTVVASRWQNSPPVVGSLLVGLRFTAITSWVMQEARRLRPYHAARCMGLLTALYGIGQTAGPLVVAWILATVRDSHAGFALLLTAASGTLIVGAALYVLMIGFGGCSRDRA